MKEDPTLQTYEELQAAYVFFNERLFQGRLPPCLITLQREKNTYGYYSQNRFVRKSDGKKTDEIALNPRYFGVRTIPESLSTLVHEMTHLDQAHYGKPGRRGWHNREWGKMMDAIGLAPSSTGQPGGKRTGDRMSHYIIEGGPFDRACDELITHQFKLSWCDRFPPNNMRPIPSPLLPSEEEEEEEDGGKGGGGLDDDDIFAPPEQKKKRAKTKYLCQGCKDGFWGKPGIEAACLKCDGSIFEEVPESDETY